MNQGVPRAPPVEGLADSDGNRAAPTRGSHQPHSQAAREMDKDEDCVL